VNDQINPIEQRKVSVPLGIGIFFLPLIFSWFTLRTGYSKVTKTVSFIWLGFTLIFAIASSKTATPSVAVNATTQTESKPEPPKVESLGLAPGMYKVGSDIQPGEYVLLGDSAYFQIASNSTGDMTAIVCNDNFSNRSIVTLSAGQYITVTNARIVPMNLAPKVAPVNNMLSEGMYKVGLDIQPGEYKVIANGSGYIEVAKDSKHSMNSIVSNDNFDNERYITIRPGQYIKLSSVQLKIN